MFHHVYLLSKRLGDIKSHGGTIVARHSTPLESDAEEIALGRREGGKRKEKEKQAKGV